METIPNDTSNDADNMILVNRVLLLDDENNLKTLIKRVLEAQFCTVVDVSNGVEGVRAVQKDDFDIIICDMMMPRMPGDKFYTAVARIRPELCRRFIFITGFQSDPKISDFISRVGGTMLTKPFEMSELMETIATVHAQPSPSIRFPGAIADTSPLVPCEV